MENGSSQETLEEPTVASPRRSQVRTGLPIHRTSLEIWTRNQRQSLLALCLLLIVFLTTERWRKPSLMTDPPPNAPLRSNEIVDRIDPNTADAAALAAIPNIGEKRAAEIVAFREKFVRDHPNQPAFGSADDLMRMKGIGPATVASLAPYLTFKSPNRAATH